MSIPAEMRELKQWLVWVPEQRDGKTTKVPYTAAETPNGRASSTDPSTWCAFEDTLIAQWAAGPGFVFTEDDDFVGIDLDACVTDGELHPVAQRIVDSLGGYAEYSPSGTGVHIIVRGSLDNHERRRIGTTPWGGQLEIYDRGRFFTVTGNVL